MPDVKVFISYAHSDRRNVERIVSALRKKTLVGWLDTTDIAAGQSIASDVRTGMERSSAVIVLLSPNALHSQWVQFEIGAAEALGKTIVPVIVSGTHLEEQFPDILRNRNWIDARDRPAADVARDVERALEAVG